MIFPQTTSKALRSIEVGFFSHPTFTWVCSKMGDAPERAILEKWMDHHGSTMKCWHFMGISNSFPTKNHQKPTSFAPFPQQHVGFLSHLDPVTFPTTGLDHRPMAGQAGASDGS